MTADSIMQNMSNDGQDVQKSGVEDQKSIGEKLNVMKNIIWQVHLLEAWI